MSERERAYSRENHTRIGRFSPDAWGDRVEAMSSRDDPSEDKAVIDRDGLNGLIAALRQAGYRVIGPRAVDGAVVYEPVEDIRHLPAGWIDQQQGGSYRLVKSGEALFGVTLGPQSWKRYLFPPDQRLWQARRDAGGFTIIPEPAPAEPFAFLGVRACELKALAVQDRVFGHGAAGGFADPGYVARRAAAFIVAVNCGRAAGTCFCVSMDAGPKAAAGFDLALTELAGQGRDGEEKRHEFVVETGSERGAAILAGLPQRAATTEDLAAAAAVISSTTAAMEREMVPGVEALLKRNLEHRRWDEVAARCLGCANCTMVCPTCFCSTVEDVTDLSGSHAERRRKWDSCFTLDFTYIHGGSIRRETRSRYRQWMTHKLSTWHEQFGVSGCTGCGRCITWCPVGIDITEEARAIRDSEGTP